MSIYIPDDIKVLFNGEKVNIHPERESVTEIKDCWKGKVELTEEGKSKLLPYMENFNNEEVTFTIDNIEYVCNGFDEEGNILFKEK